MFSEYGTLSTYALFDHDYSNAYSLKWITNKWEPLLATSLTLSTNKCTLDIDTFYKRSPLDALFGERPR